MTMDNRNEENTKEILLTLYQEFYLIFFYGSELFKS